MQQADVIILGGGLVGLTLALALDHHGLTSIVIDPADPATQHAAGFDGRASAIASASWAMLGAIGVADRLEGKGCPIRTIRVADGLAPRGLLFDADPADGPLGIMFENRLLRRTLWEAASAAPNITLLMPARPIRTIRDSTCVEVTIEDSRTVRAPLLIAAEGRNSPTREAAGITIARWRYDHAAIIATLGHERAHDGVAHEIFYPSGPFALLPMLDDEIGPRSAIVWTVTAQDASAMSGLPDRAFLAEAEKRMGGLLGPLRAASPRATYLLGFHHAATITAERLALVGDAAHGIHPIAGQGLNLGLRDVAALAEVLVEVRASGSISATRNSSPAITLARARHLPGRRRHRQPHPPVRPARPPPPRDPPPRPRPGRARARAQARLNGRSPRRGRRAAAFAAGNGGLARQATSNPFVPSLSKAPSFFGSVVRRTALRQAQCKRISWISPAS